MSSDIKKPTNMYYGSNYSNELCIQTNNTTTTDRYVAGGGQSELVYSNDGITWNEAVVDPPLSIQASVQNIVFGRNGFIAYTSSIVINVLTLISSKNGIHWKTINFQLDNIFGLAYGHGRYVLVGRNSSTNVVYYSSNGLTWTLVYSDDNLQFINIRFINNKFFVLALEKILLSSNGVTWEEATTVFSNEFYPQDIAFNNGIYVLVGQLGGIFSTAPSIYTSTDGGFVWQPANSPQYTSYVAVAYGNNRFLAVTEFKNTFNSTSVDGLNWENHAIPDNYQYSTLKFGLGKFVGGLFYNTPSSDSAIQYTEDGITWSLANGNPFSQDACRYILFNGQKFIAVGDSNSSGQSMYYSNDGVNFLPCQGTLLHYGHAVAYGTVTTI